MRNTEAGTRATDQQAPQPKQLYLVRMLCGSCYHRFDQVTVYSGHRWHQCPKCGSYFAKKVWGTEAMPMEKKDSEDKAG